MVVGAGTGSDTDAGMCAADGGGNPHGCSRHPRSVIAWRVGGEIGDEWAEARRLRVVAFVSFGGKSSLDCSCILQRHVCNSCAMTILHQWTMTPETVHDSDIPDPTNGPNVGTQ